MKVVKITAMWCSACVIMNKVWKKINDKYEIDTLELDYDLDDEEVSKYNVGKILPVFIFYEDDKEILRLTGEYKEDEMIKKISEVCELNEKNN